MKDNKKMKAILLLGYCIPYAFLAIYCDAIIKELYLYFFMIICSVILCIIAAFTNNASIAYIGIALSGVISCFFAGILLKTEDWAYYFKPFTPQSLVIILTILLLLLQTLIIGIAKIIRNFV